MTVFVTRNKESVVSPRRDSKIFPTKEEAIASLSKVLSLDEAMALMNGKVILSNNWLYRSIVTNDKWEADFSLPSRFEKFTKR